MARRVQESGLDVTEAGLCGEEGQRLRDEGLCVGEVGEVGAQCERRERVDRLGDEEAARPQLARGELEQPDERCRRKVLDDLGGEGSLGGVARRRL